MAVQQAFDPVANRFIVPAYYTNLEYMRSGKFGHVCKAQAYQGAVSHPYYQRLTQQDVVIKQILEQKAFADTYSSKLVFREIFLLKQLIHDNIVTLIDVFESPFNDIYIVTEHMPGDLQWYIQMMETINIEHIQYITYGLLRGLKYLHSAGVIHRDLKPANILINQALDIKICGFGLARATSEGDGDHTGYVTYRWYRAPEVMLTWRHYSAALDIWGAGCIVAELLNRHRNHVTLSDPESGQIAYALFPAGDPVDHIAKIVEIVGRPTDDVLTSITDQNIFNFLISKLPDGEGPMHTLYHYFRDVDGQATSFVSDLLNFDPRTRTTAADALQHPFLAGYHDPADETTRSPIQRDFEQQEADRIDWRSCVRQEIDTLGSTELPTSVAGQDPAQDGSMMAGFPMPFDSVLLDDAMALQDHQFNFPDLFDGIPLDDQQGTFDALNTDEDFLRQLPSTQDQAAQHVAEVDQLRRVLSEANPSVVAPLSSTELALLDDEYQQQLATGQQQQLGFPLQLLPQQSQGAAMLTSQDEYTQPAHLPQL
eukprot:m.18100 g.18100  ORF g.18100 m.18100 type:complete len:539 (-) comp7695_c0_seq1:252-1868(-)